MFELDPMEEIVLGVSAHRRAGLRHVKGRLRITTIRLIFEPDEADASPGPLSISLQDVSKVQTGRILGVIPKGLSIHLKSGEKHQFGTEDRDRVIMALRGQLTSRMFYIPHDDDSLDS